MTNIVVVQQEALCVLAKNDIAVQKYKHDHKNSLLHLPTWVWFWANYMKALTVLRHKSVQVNVSGYILVKVFIGAQVIPAPKKPDSKVVFSFLEGSLGSWTFGVFGPLTGESCAAGSLLLPLTCERPR